MIGLFALNPKPSSMFFSGPLQQHPAALALQSRLQSLVNSIAATLGRSELHLNETLQIVKYSQGDSYALHRDNDNSDEVDNKNHALQRAATAIIYLNTIPSQGGGGHTVFPHASALYQNLQMTGNNVEEATGVKYSKRSFWGFPKEGFSV